MSDGQAPPPPDAAVALAAEAIARTLTSLDPFTGGILWEDLARAALTAAAPVLRAEGAKNERQRIRPLVATWRAMAAEHDERVSTMARAIHGARTGVYQTCADVLADLLDGDDDG